MTNNNWRAVCGDEFLDEFQYGGGLYLAVRVDYDSKETRDATAYPSAKAA